MHDWLKFPIVLIIVAGISAIALAGLQLVTKPAKAKIQQQITQQALKVVMPEAASFEEKSAELNGEKFKYRLAKTSNGDVLGYIAEGSAEGYSSKLRVMVGVTKEFEINAIKVLYQKETPGLGDKVEEVLSKKTWGTIITGTSPNEIGLRPWFQIQFDDKKTPVKLIKHGGMIQGITGATISSHAVCKAVNDAVADLKKVLGKTTA